jgi:hypothetical protein
MVKRISLANFLEKLATIGVSLEDWQNYLVTHYAEAELEEARRAAVKLLLNSSFDECVGDRHHLPKLRQELQLIAANLVNARKESKKLIKEEWWLDWHVSSDHEFLDISWARLQVFDDLLTEIFDMDGRTIYYEDEATAAIELIEDEYGRFESLDAEDEQELGIDLHHLRPPTVREKGDLRILMNPRFPRQL